jgi:hypothetical protein
MESLLGYIELVDDPTRTRNHLRAVLQMVNEYNESIDTLWRNHGNTWMQLSDALESVACGHLRDHYVHGGPELNYVREWRVLGFDGPTRRELIVARLQRAMDGTFRQPRVSSVPARDWISASVQEEPGPRIGMVANDPASWHWSVNSIIEDSHVAPEDPF